MPAVKEPAPITRVFGVLREGMARHSFVAANFFMLRMLNRYRDELGVAALPQELTAAADQTTRFLTTQAARIRIDDVQVEAGRLRADIAIENLGGHKLPTAYPSRRAWLHVVVRDANGRAVFESGAVNADGSVQGNDNDADASKFEPHYTEVRSPDQVQIYESIIGDMNGAVTTGLLAGTQYLKDNRLLPRGFDKRTADPDIAVQGAARDDADLLYQPIGFRWANNLKAYNASEPRRFTTYYDAMSSTSSTMLARARR
jgi:hypothetical protein